MFRINKIIKSFAFIFGVISLSIGLSYAVLATWQEPGNTPPGGNVAPPLNTGNIMQIKDAGLMLNYGGNIAGFISLGAKTNPVAGFCPGGYNWYDYNSNTIKDNGECQITTLYATGTGNVGIGTQTPTAPLHILGDDTEGGNPLGVGKWFFAQGSGEQEDSGKVWFQYGKLGSPWMVMSDLDDPPRIQFQQTGTGAEFAPQFSSWIGMSRNASSDIAIVADNVGIGTSTPITGPGTVSNAAASRDVNGVNTQFRSTLNRGDLITVGGSTATVATILTDTTLQTEANIAVAHALGTSYTFVGGNRFVVKSSGNVGIGTATPSAVLDLLGTTTRETDLRLQSQAGWDAELNLRTDTHRYTVGNYGSLAGVKANKFYIADATTGSDRFIIDNAGNVGIGTTNPGSRLHVYSSSGAGGEIKVENADPLRTADVHYKADGHEWDAGASGSNTGALSNSFFIHDETLGQTRLAINTAGNVGIGTSNPNAELHILGDMAARSTPEIRIETPDVAGASDIHFIAGTPGQTQWDIGAAGETYGSGVSDKFFITDQNGAVGGKVRMVIDNAGNVGIGTTNPNSNFVVSQGTTGQGTVSNTAGGTVVTGVGTGFRNTFKIGDTITIGANTVTITAIASDLSMTTTAIASAHAAGTLYSLVGGDRLAVKGNGNVGIGTTNPQSELQLGTPNDATLDYLQIDTRNLAGAPPATDCDNIIERGRMIMDYTSVPARLYVCNGAVWRFATLN